MINMGLESFPAKKESPCLKHDCNECCKPVKVDRGYRAHVGEKFKDLPFSDRGEILIPEAEIDTTRLESYDCELLDEKTGQCKDYEKRPEICRSTECEAFSEEDPKKQAKIIDKIKKEKFICQKK